MTVAILQGNARRLPLADNSVQMCVTSPPYWGLRDYGVEGQLGMEKTPELYVAEMVGIFREVRRVLRKDGTLWLNLGDSYNGSGHKDVQVNSPKQMTSAGATSQRGTNVPYLKPKDLCGIPWLVAFALRTDGWYLRQDIIWAKPNPMPESVRDRCTKAHEYIFLLSKSAKYYYDSKAIQELAAFDGRKDTMLKGSVKLSATDYLATGSPNSMHTAPKERWQLNSKGERIRNKRSVWTINTKPFKGAHFATFPPKLVEPCILAGSRIGDTVLDPFAGSGTVGVVCQQYDRNFIGIELNEAYCKIARNRLGIEQPEPSDVAGFTMASEPVPANDPQL